jgi:endonuclease YncB( thermonuclease family)
MHSTSKITAIVLLIASVWSAVPEDTCRAQQQSFTIQVMSGTVKEEATRFAEELMNRGFTASVAELVDKEKPVYKVRVGSFTNRESAARVYESLRMKGIEGWIVPVLEQDGPQAQAAEKTGPAPAQSPEPAAAQQPNTENASSEKPFELIINPASTFPEDNKTAPSVKTEPAPEQSHKPAAAQQPDTEHAAPEKPFELIINPVPTFAGEEKQAAPSPKTEPAPVCQPAKTYKYFNPVDKTLHITNSIEKVPVQYRRQIWEIAIFPVYFKSVDLRDMSMKTDIEGATTDVLLEGITRPERAPQIEAVRDFEAALQAIPLRIKYYPVRTDPDGTLHGALFFKDGSSVELAMIRRGLAACAGDNLPWFQHKACSDAGGQAYGQPPPSAEPKK